MKKVTFKQYQELQLKHLIKAMKILDELDIRWSAQGGTLLGAVREQGWISWDDDTDVFVFNTEWNNKIEEIKKYLNNEGFELVDRFMQEGNLFWAIETREKYIVEHLGQEYARTLVVDVFPLHNTKKFRRPIFPMLSYWNNTWFYVSTKNRKEWKKFWLGFGLTWGRIALLYPYVIQRFFVELRFRKRGNVYNYGIRHDGFNKNVRVDMSKVVKMKFEDEMINVPVNYKEYLDDYFGNWDIPIRDDKRNHIFREGNIIKND